MPQSSAQSLSPEPLDSFLGIVSEQAEKVSSDLCFIDDRIGKAITPSKLRPPLEAFLTGLTDFVGFECSCELVLWRVETSALSSDMRCTVKSLLNLNLDAAGLFNELGLEVPENRFCWFAAEPTFDKLVQESSSGCPLFFSMSLLKECCEVLRLEVIEAALSSSTEPHPSKVTRGATIGTS